MGDRVLVGRPDCGIWNLKPTLNSRCGNIPAPAGMLGVQGFNEGMGVAQHGYAGARERGLGPRVGQV